MKAFLSHSSRDKPFVRQVAERLGKIQCEYDEYSFPYILNVKALRQALQRSELFVLFLSDHAITSTFVSEEERAALEALGRGTLKRVMIFAIDQNTYKALPEWMREINVVHRLQSPNACARRIQAAMVAVAAESQQPSEIYLGREEEEKALRQALSAPPGKAPVALHSVGYYGVGRRTFLRNSITKLFPKIDGFPEISCSQYDGVEELYRTLYALDRVASLEQTAKEFEEFATLDKDEQLSLVSDMIAEICAAGDLLLVIDEGGVYDELGDYQDYWTNVIHKLSFLPQPALGFIQTRMMSLAKRTQFPSAFYQSIKPLSDENIGQLLSFSFKQRQVDFTEDDIEQITQLLDGHPFNVKFVTQFAADYGVESLLADPSELIEWKRRRAEDFLRKIQFTETEIDIIATLLEYRNLASEMMVAVSSKDTVEIVRALRRLEELCCVERREGYFHIAAPLRDALRRDKRFATTSEWKKALNTSICEAIKNYQNDDNLPVFIIESATIAAAKGGDAPSLVVNMILPSHLLRIARDYYDNGKHRLCMEFCKRAYDMKYRLTLDAQVEVLRLWALSSIRTSDTKMYHETVEKLTQCTGRVAKRVALFIEGFFYRSHNKLEEAEEKYLDAWKLDNRNLSINRELASLYCKQGRYNEAEGHARAVYQIAPTNPFVIDILTETLLGKLHQSLPVDRKELNKLLEELKIYGDAPGSSFFLIRDAQRRLREGDPRGALPIINKAVERTPGLLSPYFIRAEIYLAMNAIPEAEEDTDRIGNMLTEAGGFLENEEVQLQELQIKIMIEKRLFKVAKEKIERSAILPRKVEKRLLTNLARAVAFDPSYADQRLREWSRSFKT